MRYRQSYKEKMELEKASMVAAGLISERYAGVSNIEFQMTYYQRGLRPVLMTRTLSFSPANYASFHIKCLHEGCTDGGYDLAPVVAGLASSRKKTVKGKIFCHGANDTVGHTVGHASMAYEVNIQYSKPIK
jgi:hypothetical protein